VSDAILPDDILFPNDLKSAHAVIAALRAQLAKRETELEYARKELQRLARELFGKSSEKLSAEQLRMALAILRQAPEMATEGPIEADSGESPRREVKGRKKPSGRRALPKSLPRRRVVVDLPEEKKQCGCGERLAKIGESVSEKLDYVPASYVVVETVIPRYSCPKCHDGVVAADRPAQAVEKSIAAEGFIAHVVVSKYADHLPLHRQERILARQGLDFRRSTLCGLIEAAAGALAPIADEIKRQVLASGYVQTDDTSIVVLEPDAGGSIKGRVWTYLDPLGGQVVYDATRTHERVGVERFLEGYQGHLQADAYTGYDAIYRDRRVVEVGCWAHARRRFVLALEGGEPRAAPILALVQELYQVEREGADLGFEERRALREERSRPILGRIDEERRKLAETVLPKSPLGDALRYLDNQWVALQRFIEDGRLKPDNNGAENQLRAVAVGRKNWLFAGSLAGAHRAAVLYSLVQTCRLASVDPFAYLRDVLLRVATHPVSRIAELTPQAWAQTYGRPAESEDVAR
jgi:transposase